MTATRAQLSAVARSSDLISRIRDRTARVAVMGQGYVGLSLAGHLRPGTLVVLESTTYPGTTDEVVLPAIEASGLAAWQMPRDTELDDDVLHKASCVAVLTPHQAYDLDWIAQTRSWSSTPATLRARALIRT